MFTHARFRRFKWLLICMVLLAACSPKYNWREVRGNSAPFTVLLPDKPAVLARPINLGGIPVIMTMTAAEVDDVTFAVGSAQLSDAAQVPLALAAMKEGLVNNIGGKIRQEKSIPAVATGAGNAIIPAFTEIEAVGAPAANGSSSLLIARFATHGKQIYQVLIVGPERLVSREEAKTFLSSFRLNE